MKRKLIVCDICGADITDDDIRYKFKKYKNDYANFDDFEFNKWSKLDCCKKCYKCFIEFIIEKMRSENNG